MSFAFSFPSLLSFARLVPFEVAASALGERSRNFRRGKVSASHSLWCGSAYAPATAFWVRLTHRQEVNTFFASSDIFSSRKVRSLKSFGRERRKSCFVIPAKRMQSYSWRLFDYSIFLHALATRILPPPFDITRFLPPVKRFTAL